MLGLQFMSNDRIANPAQISHNEVEANMDEEQVGLAIVKEEEVVVTPEKAEIVENSVPIPHVVEENIETVTREHTAQVTAVSIDPIKAVLDGGTSIEDIKASTPIDEFIVEGETLKISNIEIQDPELESAIISEPQETFETMNDVDAYIPPVKSDLTSSPLIPYPPPDREYISVTGFQFCDILENATFFTDIKLDGPGINGTLSISTAARLVEYIDNSAQQLVAHPEFQGNFQRETRFTQNVTADSLKRGVCWNIAQGNLVWWKPYVRFGQILDGKFGGRVLRTVDSSALSFLNFDGSQSPREVAADSPSKPHYNLAYVVMVHTNADNVAALIDALADPTVFIYLHVDLNADKKFQKEIREVIKDRQHIALMPNPFAASWAHVSLIWAEIRAFFDLLDLISFDYVINLSGADYPLKSAKTIHNHLEKKAGGNWMWWSTAHKNSWELDNRWYNMYHCREVGGNWNKKCYFPDNIHGRREFDGYKDLFPRLYKTSQWLILHRSSVEYLRSSESAKLLLMHAEHTFMPDEIFFSTFFAASPFNAKTYRDPKRMMFWNGGSHPYDWTDNDRGVIKAWAKHFMWIRKVDVIGDPALKNTLDEIRRKDKMSNRVVLKYKGGIIPVD